MKPRTIVFLDHAACWSGGEISLYNLLIGLDRTRWRPVVMLFEDGPLKSKLEMAGIETRLVLLDRQVSETRKDALGFKSLLRLREVGVLWRFCRRLARLIRSENAVLIHCNSLKADFIGAIAGRLARVPVLWHVRDRIAPDYLPRPVVIGFRLAARLLPTAIIAVSAAVLDTLQLPKRGFKVARHAYVVHDGVPEPTSNSVSVPQSAPLIGMVGRISPWKGQHIFVEAAAKVRGRFPQARFQIVGSALFGEQNYEAEVRALAQTLLLGNSLEWAGFRDDVGFLLQQMTVVVHASTTGEPFGQVIVEGMLAAKPVVATRGGGVPEIVLDGETGLLVPMNDAEALANAITALLDDPKRATDMGEQGRQRALEQFSTEASVAKVNAIYQALLTAGN